MADTSPQAWSDGVRVGLANIGSRAFGRGFLRAIAFGLCLTGAAVLAQGAWIPAKAALAQILLDRAFERSQALGRPVKAWSWADTAPVARLHVPRLGVSEVVLAGGSGQAMAFGPSLLPAGAGVGKNGTSIIAAHRDTHFTFLRNLRPGDIIELKGITDETLRYRITGSQIVRWNDFAFDAYPDRPTLLLVSCYPFGATRQGPWRFVGIAERVG